MVKCTSVLVKNRFSALETITIYVTWKLEQPVWDKELKEFVEHDTDVFEIEFPEIPVPSVSKIDMSARAIAAREEQR